MKRLLLISAACLAALAIAQGRLDIRAVFTGGAKGKAIWRVRDKGGEFAAQFQAEAERLVPGADYHVSTGGASWDRTADGLGAIRITQTYGQTGRPSIGIGTVITIEDPNGNIVSTGTFQ